MDGSGVCLHAGQEVATFVHALGGHNPASPAIVARSLVSYLAPTASFDEVAYARKLQKGLKKKRPVASLLPKNLRLVLGSDDTWFVIEHASGAVVLAWYDSNADHLAEEIVMEDQQDDAE